ncbi:HupE/UreJ family protein [Pseudolabrys sp. FHR47]|uniref:HupE/UreJ family protein n=1 Tax=Pseudolabrys sp. FHR47 TaxID=2562284 RepID=UPI001FEF07A3|nr:HupE/UreJ family protein [Pseudolabrys sp. FHR47]
MRRPVFSLTTLLAALAAAQPAFAHHVMDGAMPVTLAQGLLSGLGHPIIGLDHFAAVVAVGCIASLHGAGARLVVGYVVTMMAGVAVQLMGAGLPGAELWVAASVIALGLVLASRRDLGTLAAFAVFAVVGLLHGYALGESIYGAEQTPLIAYLAGLAIIQSVIALAAMSVARLIARRMPEIAPLRLIGAGIAGIGFAILVQQIVPAV